MSQYPSPYSPPPSPYAPPQPPIDFSSYQPGGDLLGPARRAGILLIVIGALVAMFGTCNLAGAIVIGPEEMAQQQAELRGMGLPQSPIDPGVQRVLSGVFAGLTLLVGIALAVNGASVRRGSSLATTVGMVVTGGLGLLVGLLVVMFGMAAFVAPPMAVGACIMTVPLGLLVWAFIWLVAAARHGPRLAAAQQQYAANYYQLQQQQHAYAQPGAYGMPYAPPPQQAYAPQSYGYTAAPPQPQPYGQTPGLTPAPPNTPAQQPPPGGEPSPSEPAGNEQTPPPPAL